MGDAVKTLYIDVYFLINFTVDVLSLYFSAHLGKFEIKVHRLIISGIIAAALAVIVTVFAFEAVGFFISLTICIISVTLICVPKVGVKRKVRFASGFLIIETALGGFVSLCYSILNRYLYPIIEGVESKLYNKNIFIFSLMILVAYLVVKITLMFFDGVKSERSATFSAELFGEEYSFQAFVDTGLLVKDPMDNKPVIILKGEAVRKRNKEFSVERFMFTENIKEKERIRIIPIKGVGGEKILYGYRTNASFNNTKGAIAVVIAIDEEEGDFGGYEALISAEVVNIIYD